MLNFTWKVVKMESYHVTINMDFMYKLNVSRSSDSRDKLQITFMKPWIFRAKDNTRLGTKIVSKYIGR